MIVVALVWAWATAVCFAWGALAEAALARAAEGDDAPLAAPVVCWLGLVVVTTLAALVSFVHPVDGTVAAVVSIAGLAGFAAVRGARPTARVPDAATMALGTIVVAVALADAAVTPTNYDTGLYHAQAIRWIEAHPVVPGLGNLHFRLAFGSAWFLPEALFGSAPVAGPSRHVLVGCGYVWTALWALGGLRALAAGRGSFAVVARIATLPLALLLARGWLSSPSPDVALALVAWTTIALALDASERGGLLRPGRPVLAAALLATFATAIKPSAAPLLLLPAGLAVTTLRRRPGVSLGVGVLVVAVGAPHVARNVILSGYPAFPVPFLPPLAVDWAVPPSEAVRQADWIMSWARLPRRPPEQVLALPIGEWIGPWFARRPWIDRALLGAIPVLGIVALASVRRPARHPLVWTVLWAGTLSWFLLAPDPRFGWGYYPIVALGLAARVVGPWTARLPPRETAHATSIAFAVLCLWPWIGSSPARAPLVVPAPYAGRPLRTVRIGDLVVSAPARGDQCGDAPIPCTPYPAAGLERRGSDLAQGFRMGTR